MSAKAMLTSLLFRESRYLVFLVLSGGLHSNMFREVDISYFPSRRAPIQ